MALNDAEGRARGEAAGLKFDTILTANDLVSGDNTMFIATGVTDGGLVDGVRLLGDTIRTESVVLRSKSGTFRRIVSEHVAGRWVERTKGLDHVLLRAARTAQNAARRIGRSVPGYNSGIA